MVSLVLVGHSHDLVAALAAAIRDATATPPPCFTAGGTDDGRMGTSLARVHAALRSGLDASDEECLVLYDTGSAWLTIGFAVDELAPSERARVRVSDAPLVEGALAAAALAAEGAPIAEVEAAADAALRTDKQPPGARAVDAMGVRRSA